MLHKSRRYLLFLLGGLALGYFFYKFRNSIRLEGFRWATVGRSLQHANLPLLVISTLVIYACFAIRSLRWMRFSRTLGETHFRNVYPATLMGFACIFLLGRAGEPVRPVLIARKDSLSIPRMFGVYVLERVFDMAATIVIASASLLLLERRGVMRGVDGPLMRVARSAGAALLVGLAVAVGFLIYFRYYGASWLATKLQRETRRTGWRQKIAVLLEGFSDGLQGIRTWGDLGVLVCYTAAHWFLVALVYLWIVHALGGELAQLDFSSAVLVFAFTMVGSVAQLPVAGGGAQVATFLVLNRIFGVERESAVTAAVMIWLITFASSCLVGLPMLFREGWSMGELRKMAEAGKEEAKLAEEAELSELAKSSAPSKRLDNSGGMH